MQHSFLVTILLVLSVITATAQGPDLAFFYNQDTHLPWAEASLNFKSGAKAFIKFMPVNDKYNSPAGSINYTSDMELNMPLVFIPGNNHDTAISIKNRAILYCCDTDKKNQNLVGSLNSMITKGAGAVILFSENDEFPFLKIRDKNVSFPIPVITVTLSAANSMLSASGYNTKELWAAKKKGTQITIRQPIVNFSLKVKGRFAQLSSRYADIRFNPGSIDSMAIKSLLAINDSAMRFITMHFNSITPRQNKSLTTYFADYDEKLFYTAHWGKGLANDNGVFSVFDGSNTDYTLAVHELTHTFFKNNLNGNISFLAEGVAKYSEAQAVKSSINNKKTLEYLKAGNLLPLTELVKLDIGSDKNYTDMGYFSSGSFVQFLIETRGQQKFIQFWQTYQEWEKIYSLSLAQLEKEWHTWLKKN